MIKKVHETLDPSLSSSAGLGVVEAYGWLGGVVGNWEWVCVALATPTERRRRFGLERQRSGETVSKGQVKCHWKTDWRKLLNTKADFFGEIRIEFL